MNPTCSMTLIVVCASNLQCQNSVCMCSTFNVTLIQVCTFNLQCVSLISMCLQFAATFITLNRIKHCVTILSRIETLKLQHYPQWRWAPLICNIYFNRDVLLCSVICARDEQLQSAVSYFKSYDTLSFLFGNLIFLSYLHTHGVIMIIM